MEEHYHEYSSSYSSSGSSSKTFSTNTTHDGYTPSCSDIPLGAAHDSLVSAGEFPQSSETVPLYTEAEPPPGSSWSSDDEQGEEDEDFKSPHVSRVVDLTAGLSAVSPDPSEPTTSQPQPPQPAVNRRLVSSLEDKPQMPDSIAFVTHAIHGDLNIEQVQLDPPAAMRKLGVTLKDGMSDVTTSPVVRVRRVVEGSQADLAGIRSGDTLHTIGLTEVYTLLDIETAIATHNDKIEHMVFKRENGKTSPHSRYANDDECDLSLVVTMLPLCVRGFLWETRPKPLCPV